MEDRRGLVRLDSNVADFNTNLVHALRAQGGRVDSGPFAGRSLLILTTRGAKTGEPREHPLVYHRDGDRLVIVASKGGAPHNPAWYHNLLVNPDVTVELDGETFPARAAAVDDEAEYERLYADHAAMMPAFNDYRKRTTRRIPVVLLARTLAV
jgi:deazaflavin-dependent oxidoreductase (nitroreductase family)